MWPDRLIERGKVDRSLCHPQDLQSWARRAEPTPRESQRPNFASPSRPSGSASSLVEIARSSPSPPAPCGRCDDVRDPVPLVRHLARRCTHQPRIGNLHGSTGRRVVPWPRWCVHRRLGGERMVLTPPAEGRWRPCRRDHSQAHSRPHDGANRRGTAFATAISHRAVRQRQPLPARANGRRSDGPSKACPRSTKPCSGRTPSTRATWWASPGWTPNSSRPRSTQAARSPVAARTPIPLRFPHLMPQTRCRVQRRVLDVRCKRRLLHRQQDRCSVASGRGLLRGLQERLGHRGPMGP